ncbi:hypothetical protein LB505_001629 [Fusarium chuoi]|nr:hypothetical protein LB505_001629 [Fusarium chuoi]
MPNKTNVEAAAVYGEQEDEVQLAQCGDQVRIRLKGIEEDDILPGFVLCSPKRLVHTVAEFEAQIRILELKSILTAGNIRSPSTQASKGNKPQEQEPPYTRQEG